MKPVTYTHAEAAAIIGVSTSTVSRMVRSDRLATNADGLITVWALADYLDTTPGELREMTEATDAPQA